MNPSSIIVRRLSVLMSVTFALNVWADDDHKPLPRPELLPLSPQRLQQIQGLSRAVITARQSQAADPRSTALRGALLDIRAEMGSWLAATRSPERLASVPCAPERCPPGPEAQSASRINLAGMQAKRQVLRAAIAEAASEPKLAHMANKARELELEIDAATQAPQEQRLSKLIALYRTLEPRATLGPDYQTPSTVLAPRHTLVHHQPGVRRDGN